MTSPRLALAAVFVAVSCGGAPLPEGPNVLFVLVDDLNVDLGCYDRDVVSPHIDRLAARGLVFDRAYCQQALCSPSRTSVMTGLRPDTSGIRDLRTHFRTTVPDVVTLPQHFAASGYFAASVGKVYQLGLDDELSWSEPREAFERQPYVLEENIAFREQHERRGPPVEAADREDLEYVDAQLAGSAIRMLRRVRDRPFFLAVGFMKPHLPFSAPQRFWDLYEREHLALRTSPPPEDAPPGALTNGQEIRRFVGVPASGALPEEMARELVHGYYACTSFVDAQVGRLLDELDELGLTDETIVVLWGDHGFHLGELGVWAKNTNFEAAARVPLIVATPSTSGKRTAALVESIDLYPTLCELAGLPLPDHLEGTSLAPLLEDPERDWNRAAFSQVSRGDRVTGHSMRTARYRLTRWRRGDRGPATFELYDYERDGEARNCADDPEYAPVLRELVAELDRGSRTSQPQR